MLHPYQGNGIFHRKLFVFVHHMHTWITHRKLRNTVLILMLHCPLSAQMHLFNSFHYLASFMTWFHVFSLIYYHTSSTINLPLCQHTVFSLYHFCHEDIHKDILRGNGMEIKGVGWKGLGKHVSNRRVRRQELDKQNTVTWSLQSVKISSSSINSLLCLATLILYSNSHKQLHPRNATITKLIFSHKISLETSTLRTDITPLTTLHSLPTQILPPNYYPSMSILYPLSRHPQFYILQNIIIRTN